MVQFLLKEGFEDKPGMITTPKHMYSPNCFKVDTFKQHSTLQQ
jgi:hypothetical protein